jgi:hypothetical protein
MLTTYGQEHGLPCTCLFQSGFLQHLMHNRKQNCFPSLGNHRNRFHIETYRTQGFLPEMLKVNTEGTVTEEEGSIPAF